MVLQRWAPLFDFRRAMNRHVRASSLPRSASSRSSFSQSGDEKKEWAIPLDVVEQDELLVKASVPGVKLDDIDVSIENRVLTIKA